MSASAPPTRNLKVIMIGESAVGKTSLAYAFTNDMPAAADLPPTIGLNLMQRTITVDGTAYVLSIWDTGGQERYRAMTRSYYRSIAIAFIVYDVTDRDSFDAVLNWASEVSNSLTGSAAATLVLVGNKTDLGPSARVVSTAEGAELARAHDMLFTETSARSAVGVAQAFEEAVLKYAEQEAERGAGDGQQQGQGRVNVEESASSDGGSYGCC